MTGTSIEQFGSGLALSSFPKFAQRNPVASKHLLKRSRRWHDIGRVRLTVYRAEGRADGLAIDMTIEQLEWSGVEIMADYFPIMYRMERRANAHLGAVRD